MKKIILFSVLLVIAIGAMSFRTKVDDDAIGVLTTDDPADEECRVFLRDIQYDDVVEDFVEEAPVSVLDEHDSPTMGHVYICPGKGERCVVFIANGYHMTVFIAKKTPGGPNQIRTP